MMKYLNILILLIIISCTNNGPTTPKDPLWERENCSHCHMVLSEKRFAVQRILQNGKTLYYDDINCALNDEDNKEGNLFVRPDQSDEWVPAEDVKYQSGLRSPMGSGFGAVTVGGDTDFKAIQKRYKE